VEEVSGQQARCLGAQEGAPSGVRSPRRGADAGPGEDTPDRPRADAVAKLGEFASDAAMPQRGLSRASRRTSSRSSSSIAGRPARFG